MPLFTDDMGQAQVAYRALESRAVGAERHAQALQAVIADLRARLAVPFDDVASLRQRILDLEAENFKLRTQIDELARLKIDLPLQNFIASVGLAAAIGEASMPDRAITALAAKAQAYLAPSEGGVGLRFQQPELGALAVGLSATSFDLAKVPPPPGRPAPRNLYAVLQEKQRVFTNPFWSRFEPATRLVVEVAKILSDVGGWNFAYLAQSASALAALEKLLAPFVAEASPPETASAYTAAVDALSALADSLKAKANPVAGDLSALSAALDAVTNSIRTFLP